VLALAVVVAVLAVTGRVQPSAADFSIVRPGAANGTIALHAFPNGPVRVRLRAHTVFGSPLAFSVARTRGRWLGVRSDALPNGRLGWIDASRARLRWSSTRLWLEADLSRRELVLHRGDVVVRRMRIAIGRTGSPTPTGRFAVTDKLPGARIGRGFGCCVLALTAHQTRLPSGWPGGDRIAIHGGDDRTLGAAVSAGCLHASAKDLRVLMRSVPLGTPVVVHA
jgi:hypothetical protein